MALSKKVCIIGSGASGLSAIKSCLDEGLHPTCYEMSEDIGGLWKYVEDETEGACVYKSTIINTSKEMMCYSDFPIPKEFANFMHNTKIAEYFNLYCKEFKLRPYIQFNTEVLRCELSGDYEETGKWNVTTRNRLTSKETTEVFDGILVCIGHHSVPYFPKNDFPGINKFRGEILHSHSYRIPKGYEDKRIVVIGIGNSGGDLAVELGKCAKRLYLSTRRGAWVLQRVGTNGTPIDLEVTRRISVLLSNVVPHSLINYLGEKRLNGVFDHAKYGLKPQHGLLSQHPMINDSLPNSILSGAVVVKGNVTRFTENGVVFEDGTSEEVDVVMFATGYIFGFPFLDESIIKVHQNRCRLFRLMWPPHLKHGSLAVIGGIQPLGAVNPISEMQCRWATRVFAGHLKLPPRHAMDEEVNQRTSEMDREYYKSQRHTLQVNYMNYMDEIADEIGAKPDVIKLLKTDFKLGLKVLFGPCSPYQYRLQGPGAWSEARETIMTLQERVDYPLATRAVHQDSSRWLLKLSIILFFLAFLFYRF